MSYYCNPLDLEYRYQNKKGWGSQALFREAADPTMVVFKGKYYLFCSMTGGFWYSDNLLNWEFHETPELPIYHYAPDVREINGQLLFCASSRDEACKLYRSPDPLNVPFQPVSTVFPFWDPNLFQDDDGRIYLYWGCSSKEPIYGIELDKETLQPIGEKKVLFGENVKHHGWERKGENNQSPRLKTTRDIIMRFVVGTKPFIEGAYMNKYNGKYYLQYAAPGTETNVYSDGVYVADSPLGPFTYQQHNPFSSVPGGFAQGAGHGSTFRDLGGKWWHIATVRISKNENFERRIGLYPCEFDQDGILWCDQNFACYPKTIDGNAAPTWMLLSGSATASSCQSGFEAEKGNDEDIRTWWAAATSDADPWYRLDLGKEKSVHAIQLNFADHQLPFEELTEENSVQENVGRRHIYVQPQVTSYLLEGSADGENWEILLDTREENSDRSHRFLVLPEEKKLRYLRVSDFRIPFGGTAAISGLRVFGRGNCEKPEQVEKLFARKSKDGLNIHLHWPKAEGAEGYNIRYGIAKDKLYNSWQVIGKAELDLSTVNAGVAYWAAVDSYNENGITKGKVFHVR